MTLRIGTRGSTLALWQAEEVKRLIGRLPGAPAVELITIKTRGDLNTDIPLWQAGGKGFFTAELDRALIGGEVDLVVHSLKDLTTVLEAALTIGAVIEREDPRDVLVTRDNRSLADLPRGATIGTSSLRRRAFISHLRPDLQQTELRGNVPTRLKKLDDGAYDGIILAAAGLKRLGLGDRVTRPFAVDEFPPAVAQGAIAVAIRANDAATARWINPLDHGPTRLAVTAERALLRKLEGGCQVPIGGLATVTGDRLQLQAAACNLDGSDFMSVELSGAAADAEKIGEEAAAMLLKKGAGRILEGAAAKRASQA
jgi:hydroxymethylbilane synthase